ncbi:hypothetical protein HCUR_01205 [Holospora curviuscula]|uniref:Uncharacterized protein n=1 Tax=Holospora curviuscula TaxID=1082868 RepID=A0A2S5R7Q1_9PROT|nr:hypothetical protein HCUR_01205 [Holospora curviuscula]
MRGLYVDGTVYGTSQHEQAFTSLNHYPRLSKEYEMAFAAAEIG